VSSATGVAWGRTGPRLSDPVGAARSVRANAVPEPPTSAGENR
jgi:hypothetical protein